MYLTAHAAVGVLLSETADEPAWVFLWGFLSHFVLDFLPHGDEDVAEWIRARPKIGMIVGAVDCVFLTALLLAIFAAQAPERTARVTAGVLGALLPDMVTNVVPYFHRHVPGFSFLGTAHQIQKKLRIAHLWRGHDWFHIKSHNALRAYLTFWQGIAFQCIITASALLLFVSLAE